MNKAKRIVLATFIVSLLTIFGSSRPTMAASLEESPEFQKALATSLSACYTRGAFKDEITLASYGASGSIKSVMSSTGDNVRVPIPYGYTSSTQFPSMLCSEILSRALAKKGLSIPAKFEDARSVLTEIGYTKVTAKDPDNEKTCFWFEYDVNVDDIEWINGGGDYRTRDEVWKSNQVCLVEYKENGATWTRLDGINSNNGGNSKILDIKQESGTSVIKFQTKSFGVNDDWILLDAHQRGSAKDFMLNMYNKIIATKHGRTGKGEMGTYVNKYTIKGYQDQHAPVGSDTMGTTYYIQANAADKVPEDLFGVTRLFDQTNTFIMYQNYLMKYYGAMTIKVDPNDPTQDSLRTGADQDLGGYSKVKVYNNGKVEECYVKPKTNSGTLYGVSNNRFGGIDATTWQYPSPVFQVSYDDIVKFLNGTTPSGSQLKSHSDYIIDASCAQDEQQEQKEPTNPGNGSGNNNNNGSTGDFDSDECYDAAGSLGWILCPVLKVVTEATDSIYKDYIQKDFLEVKTTWMDQVYSSWDSIRKIANLLFVIFFVIIVFSQLTGIGLTNYAIKKALPRLVMVVVLVNVSFLICQLAVDLSNILGYTLNAMFDGLAQSGGGGSGGLEAIGNGIMSAVSWAGIAIVAYKTAAFWLIPFLLAALSAIISVIFGALILGIRQAGVLVLVALAPAAIACYALPNTKSLFDKWSKAFLSLLIVFPICGALVGGGNFAASLILKGASDNVMLGVIALLLRVAPFFFIPSIVKSSLTALGNIGMRVSNFGSRLSRSATGAIAKSDAAKYADASLRAGRADQIQRSARRRSAFNKKLRNVPGIGGIVTAAEDSALGQKIGAASKGRRDAKIARLYSRSNKLLSDEAAAGGMRHLQRGTPEYEAMVESARYGRISSMAKDIQGQYTTIASDLDSIGPLYEQAIRAYENNSSDENLATLQAMGNMALDNGDPGRGLYHNKLGWAVEQGYKKSVQAMGQHMLREHVKDIKPVARDTFVASVDAAKGELKAESFFEGTYTNSRTNKSENHYVSNAAATESISGYDAASLLKMDEGAIKRLTIAAQNGGIESGDRAAIDRLTTEALTNPRLFAQPKIKDELNDLRDALQLGRINGLNGVPEGEVLRTGNDDRSGKPKIELPGDLSGEGIRELTRDK